MKNLILFLLLVAPVCIFSQDSLYLKNGQSWQAQNIQYFGTYLNFKLLDHQPSPKQVSYQDLSGILLKDFRETPFGVHKKLNSLRIFYDSGKKVKGRFFSVEEDQILLINKNNQIHPYSFDGAERIVVRKHNATLKGFLIGGGVGVVGVTLLAVAVNERGSTFSDALPGLYLLGITIGGLEGALRSSFTNKKFRPKDQKIQAIKRELRNYSLAY